MEVCFRWKKGNVVYKEIHTLWIEMDIENR